VILITLTLGSLPVLQGIKLQQLSLFVAGLVAISAGLLDRRYLFGAGALLAVATIKPQLVFLLAAWLLLWAISDWPGRKNFVWGFVATMAVLLGASEYMMPGWMGRFREAVEAYRQYNEGAESVLEVLFTPLVGRVLTATLFVALFWVCWRLRRVSSDSASFRWLIVLLLAVTVMVMPKTAPYNQVLLLPGVLFVLQHGKALWARSMPMRVIAAIAGLLVFWPWFAALLLFTASLVLHPAAVQQAWALPFYTSVLIPIAVTAVIIVYINELAFWRHNRS
jgi:hypothetical protein